MLCFVQSLAKLSSFTNDNICCYMSKDGIWVKGSHFLVRHWTNICIYTLLGKNKKSMKKIYATMCKKKYCKWPWSLYYAWSGIHRGSQGNLLYPSSEPTVFLSITQLESNVTDRKPVGLDDVLYPVWFDPWLLTIRSTTNGGLLLFKVLCLVRKGFSMYMYWADSTLMSRLFRPGPFTS